MGERRLLPGGQPRIEPHHATVVGIARAGHAEFVSVVDKGSPLLSEKECPRHPHASVGILAGGLPRRGCPALFLRTVAPHVGYLPRRVRKRPGHVVVAQERGHHCRASVVAFIAIHEPAKRVKPALMPHQRGQRRPEHREIELAIQQRRADVCPDGLLFAVTFAGEGLADHVEPDAGPRVDVFIDSRPERGREVQDHVLDRIQSESVDVRFLNQPYRVVHDPIHDRAVPVVEIGKVLGEPAFDRSIPAAHVPLADGPAIPVEPGLGVVAMFRVKRGVGMNVVRDKIDDHAYPAGVGGVDHFLEIIHVTEMRVDRTIQAIQRLVAGPARRYGPVGVITRVFVTVRTPEGALRVHYGRGNPQAIHAQIVEIPGLDPGLQAGEVAPLPVRLRVQLRIRNRFVVGRIPVTETIGQNEIDRGVPPVEWLILDPEWHEQWFGGPSSRILDPEQIPVLARSQTGIVDREGARRRIPASVNRKPVACDNGLLRVQLHPLPAVHGANLELNPAALDRRLLVQNQQRIVAIGNAQHRVLGRADPFREWVFGVKFPFFLTAFAPEQLVGVVAGTQTGQGALPVWPNLRHWIGRLGPAVELAAHRNRACGRQPCAHGDVA